MSYKEIPKFSTFRKSAKIGFQEDDKVAALFETSTLKL